MSAVMSAHAGSVSGAANAASTLIIGPPLFGFVAADGTGKPVTNGETIPLNRRSQTRNRPALDYESGSLRAGPGQPRLHRHRLHLTITALPLTVVVGNPHRRTFDHPARRPLPGERHNPRRRDIRQQPIAAAFHWVTEHPHHPTRKRLTNPGADPGDKLDRVQRQPPLATQPHSTVT